MPNNAIQSLVVAALATLMLTPVFSSRLVAKEGPLDASKMAFEPRATYLLTLEDGKRYAGRVEKLHSQIRITRRNGKICYPRYREIVKVKQVDDQFVPKTFEQIRKELRKEFPAKYTVSRTDHYLVVHPNGAWQKWAQPFESFYVNFRAWCRSRGIATRDPEFPLVAVVLQTQGEFQRIASIKNMGDFGGYYSPSSNRFLTYLTDYRWLSAEENFQHTMQLMNHEAAHQMACNTGVEDRRFDTPTWFSEGLATLFEARGIHKCLEHSSRADRVSVSRLKTYLQCRDRKQTAGIVKRLLSTEGNYHADKELCYSSSWALMMFLAETKPAQLAKYIERQTNERGNIYLPSVRQDCFKSTFGKPEVIEAQMNAFMTELAKTVGVK